MRTARLLIAALLLGAGAADANQQMVLKRCPPDSVISGSGCMDTYEASVWRVLDPLGANKGR